MTKKSSRKKENEDEAKDTINFLEALVVQAMPNFLAFAASAGAVEILETMSDVHIEAAIDRLRKIENSTDTLRDLYSVRDHLHTAHIAAKKSLHGFGALLRVISIVGIISIVTAVDKVYRTAALLAVMHHYFREPKNVTDYIDTAIEYYNRYKDMSWDIYHTAIRSGGYARMPEFEESDKVFKQLCERLAPGRLEQYTKKRQVEQSNKKRGFFNFWL